MTQTRYITHYTFNSFRAHSAQYMRKIAQHILTQIVEHTPVHTGRAKANWRLSLDSWEEGKWSCDTDPAGDATIDHMIDSMQAFVPGDRIYISNSVPYIMMLENGYSNQAPDGILAVVERETQQLINGWEL
ncbi:MAG: hypothetical protein PHQ75_08675 [Thermoguttaceae bacterium]|nr:hypothetical protein [Thermoguttaceae bacterium]